MINLLPPEIKEHITYARRNAYLERWIVLLITGIVGLILVVGFGVFYIDHTINGLKKDISESSSLLEARDINGTQKEATQISTNLKLMLQVFSKQVLFSKLIRQIGAVLPPGSAIGTLNLTDTQNVIDFDVGSNNFATATQIPINLQDANNKLFTKVDVISVACNQSKDSTFACNTSLRGVINKDSDFKFIKKSVEGQ